MILLNPSPDDLLSILGGDYRVESETVAGYSGSTYVTLSGDNGNQVILRDTADGVEAEVDELLPIERSIFEAVREAARLTRHPLSA